MADYEEQVRCPTCSAMFESFEHLLKHQIDSIHPLPTETPSGDAYLCWKKGCNQYFSEINDLHAHFSNIHVKSTSGFAYKCTDCPLAFRKSVTLRTHSSAHALTRALTCVVCARNFRSLAQVHVHFESVHRDDVIPDCHVSDDFEVCAQGGSQSCDAGQLTAEWSRTWA